MQHTCVLHVVLVNALKNIYYYTAGEYNKKRKLQTMFTVYELANFLPLEYIQQETQTPLFTVYEFSYATEYPPPS